VEWLIAHTQKIYVSHISLTYVTRETFATLEMINELLTNMVFRTLVCEAEPFVACSVKSQSPRPSNVDAVYSRLITAMCHAGFSSPRGERG
jgi:hypothetical protein